MDKSFKRFLEEASSKKCPEGKYWCFTDKCCKKIPKGYHIGGRGYLEQDDDDSKKNGNGNGSNGNGNGSNGNGNGNGNGGGGMGESYITIENSDGKEFAQVINIIEPEPMKSPKSPIKWEELTINI
tara:strand:+ start:192 stop:569 length:378 start_codon:yes stop_codon:yes gene_type:complete